MEENHSALRLPRDRRLRFSEEFFVAALYSARSFLRRSISSFWPTLTDCIANSPGSDSGGADSFSGRVVFPDCFASNSVCKARASSFLQNLADTSHKRSMQPPR